MTTTEPLVALARAALDDLVEYLEGGIEPARGPLRRGCLRGVRSCRRRLEAKRA